MNQETYDECLRYYQNNNGTPFWNKLAQKYGFPSGEAIRSAFRREKQRKEKRDITSLQYVGGSPSVQSIVPKKLPKVLIFDVETSYASALLWPQFHGKQHIPIDNMLTDWYTFCWAGKWLFQNETFGALINPDNILRARRNFDRDTDDYDVIKPLWDKLNEADCVIGYNSNSFDIRKMNARFLKYDLNPPLPFRSIDLYETVKTQFETSSGKLDFINSYLNIPVKLGTDGKLWRECWMGNSESLEKMYEYNINDAEITESLYLKIRKWIKNHPNFNIYDDAVVGDKCKICHKDLEWQDKYHTTPVGKYQIFRCSGCGTVGRSRDNVLSKEKRKTLYI